MLSKNFFMNEMAFQNDLAPVDTKDWPMKHWIEKKILELKRKWKKFGKQKMVGKKFLRFWNFDHFSDPSMLLMLVLLLLLVLMLVLAMALVLLLVLAYELKLKVKVVSLTQIIFICLLIIVSPTH